MLLVSGLNLRPEISDISLLLRCIFFKPAHSQTNAVNEIIFVTILKPLHVSATGCNSEGVTEQMKIIQTRLSPSTLKSLEY